MRRLNKYLSVQLHDYTNNNVQAVHLFSARIEILASVRGGTWTLMRNPSTAPKQLRKLST